MGSLGSHRRPASVLSTPLATVFSYSGESQILKNWSGTLEWDQMSFSVLVGLKESSFFDNRIFKKKMEIEDLKDIL